MEGKGEAKMSQPCDNQKLRQEVKQATNLEDLRDRVLKYLDECEVVLPTVVRMARRLPLENEEEENPP